MSINRRPNRRACNGSVIVPITGQIRTKVSSAAIDEPLDARRNLTFSVFLFYAFTPLPRNYPFIVYGSTTMRLPSLAISFFPGHSVNYSFWGLTGLAVPRRIRLDPPTRCQT
jgi:hypothetical protein